MIVSLLEMEANTNGGICHDLTTTPKPELGTILVTGATGYIGGRLVPELILRGYKVRVMVRSYSPVHLDRWPEAEIIVADALDLESLLPALEGVHTAYFLIHSLKLGHKKFEETDLNVASNFRIAAENQGVKRIIYLSGLGREDRKLSPHLANRMLVAERLSQGKIPVTVLRAGMIIGSGSASYEIVENLVKNTPIFFIPYWAKTKSQPIAVRDVIKYMVGCLETEATAGHIYDIGGSAIINYDEMLKSLAKIQGRRRLFLPALFTNTAIYGYIASLLTPVPGPITKVLIEGCKNEVICQNNDIKELIHFTPLSYEEAVRSAMKTEERDSIPTRWSDAYPPESETSICLCQLDPPPRYMSSSILLTFKSPEALFNSFCHVGGKMGWFHSNWMWRMRGALDRLIMGVGTSRGRRSYKDLRVGDVVDFFRVEDIIPNQKLLLRAEMKVPGYAWLEFNIESYNALQKLSVHAYFKPRGIWGILYWYNFLPFHFYLFNKLIKLIEKRS